MKLPRDQSQDFVHLPTAWQACIEAYLRTSNTPAYRTHLRFFFRSNRSPGEYTKKDVEAFVNGSSTSTKNKGKPIVDSTKNQRLQVLIGFYSWASTYQVEGKPLYQKIPPTRDVPYVGSLAQGIHAQADWRDKRSVAGSQSLAHLPPPWQECIAQFLVQIKDHRGSDSSFETYRGYIAGFFRFCEKSPGDVTKTDVLNWIQSPTRSRRNYGGAASASTKNLRRCTLASLYRFASDYEIDGKALFDRPLPTRGIKHLARDISFRAMNNQQLAAFFSVIPTDTLKGIRDRCIFTVYLFTARRRREIALLKWGDIEASEIREKNGGTRQGYIYRYRSKGAQRTVKTAELPLRAWQAIEGYLKASGRLATMQPDEPIFASTYAGHRGEPLNHNWIEAQFKQYARLASLPETFTIHSLRHTNAMNRRLAGQDLFELKEALGHQSIATTYNYCLVMEGVSDPGAALLEARFAFLSQ